MSFHRLLAAALLGGGFALLMAAPAAAHGDTIDFAISTDPSGRVIATPTWDGDQHPVTEPVSATLNATSPSGKQLGPLPLRRGKGNVLVLEQRLEPGAWTVVVESAEPALGRGEANLTITPPVSTVTTQVIPDEARPERALGVQPASPVAEVATLSALTATLGAIALILWRRRTA